MKHTVESKIIQKKGKYETEEGCLSLDGVRPCTRYEEIEVEFFNQNFEPQHAKYTGLTAESIQH